MQDIDLGDRSGLIDLIYGPPGKESNAPNSNNNASTPLRENAANAKQAKKNKKKSVITCGFCTACFLFLLAAAAIFLSGFIAYWVTKQDYQRQLALANYSPQPRRNMSMFEEVWYEDEKEPPVGPTAEELKLPNYFVPVWYNFSTKIYFPEEVKAGEEPDFKTDNHVLIKMRAETDTDKIVLNAGPFKLPDVAKIQLLTEKTEKPLSRVRRDESSDNSTTTDTETLINDVSLNETATTDENSETPELLTTELTEDVTEETTMSTTTTTEAPPPEYESSGIKVTGLEYNATVEKIIFTLDKPISAGSEVILKFPYGGKITRSLNGIYYSSYTTPTGEKRYLVSTHMEPVHARQMVPCFDEPHLKAPWKISVIHPNSTRARSNADTLSEDDVEPGWVQTTFDQTGPIATYLTALVVSDFDYKEASTKSGATIRVWSRPYLVNSTEYALNKAVKIVDLLEDYYGSELPYRKQDLFALPSFEPGAMENPGLLTFRETALLYDPKFDEVAKKITITQKISHELNHQWFGNLVTLSGWDSLWLNEAFANYMEYYTMEKALDDAFDIDEYELLTSIERALTADELSSSHPLTSKIETGADVKEMFDIITYEKGASVVRMFKKVLGDDAFRKGVQKYLEAHKNGNANYTELWKALNEAKPSQLLAYDGTPFDIQKFADNWILQMGYPVIDIYRIDGQTVEITQRRFKLDNLTPEPSKYRDARFWYKWEVPLFMTINGKEQPLKWLHEATRIPLNLTDTLVINSDSYGFYRVNYDEAGWAQIVDTFQNDHKKLSAMARARILSDAFALAEAGQLSYEVPLNLTRYLPKETDYAPTVVALRELKRIYNHIKYYEEGAKFKPYIIKNLLDQYDNIDLQALSTQDEKEFPNVDRLVTVAETLCTIHPKACKKTMAAFSLGILAKCSNRKYSSDCSTVPIPLRDSVYCTTVARDDDVFDTFFNFARNEIAASEKVSLVKALGCSRSPVTLTNLLRKTLLKNSTTFSRGNLATLVKSIKNNDVGNLIITNFFLDNWKELYETMADDFDVLSKVLSHGLTATSKREVSQLEKFVDDHKTAKQFTAFKKRLETGRSSVRWIKHSRESISKFLENESKLN